jgi:hypothetical protein
MGNPNIYIYMFPFIYAQEFLWWCSQRSLEASQELQLPYLPWSSAVAVGLCVASVAKLNGWPCRGDVVSGPSIEIQREEISYFGGTWFFEHVWILKKYSRARCRKDAETWKKDAGTSRIRTCYPGILVRHVLRNGSYACDRDYIGTTVEDWIGHLN